MNPFLPHKISLYARRSALVLILGTLMSACSATQKSNSSADVNSIIDPHCKAQAFDMERHAQATASVPQYLAAARALDNCIPALLPDDISDDESQYVMQMMAVSTLNYLKGGDVANAQNKLEQFDRRFPQQDLYFRDYTSFRDTANALLFNKELSENQIASLNISRQLRDELERQHYWLSH